MGSFQIVYDDFSGGQYMGPRSQNWPKNTWFGGNMLPLANGQLVASGAVVASQYKSPPAGTTAAIIADQWVVGNDLYSFVEYTSSGPTYTSRMIKTAGVNDGTTFLITPSVTSLTGRLSGKIAYDPTSTKFFYVDAGNIRTVTTGGTTATASTALSATGVTDITLYNFRMVVWGGTSKRLYYSATDLTTYSTGDYYEFNGEILNVLPRSNDLLVFCTTGVYSLVGVLGASVTSQLIVPQLNVTEGMRSAVVVGRTPMFVDQSLTGSLDGRLYRMVGSNIQAVESFNLDDINALNNKGPEAAVIQALSNNNIAIAMRNGVVYATVSPGQWTRLFFEFSVNTTTAKQFHIAKPGPNSQNEYFMLSYLNTSFHLTTMRYIYSVTAYMAGDANITAAGDTGSSGTAAIGVVNLPEYWHSRPFTVKEALVQFKKSASGELLLKTVPSGVIQLPSANLSAVDSSVIFVSDAVAEADWAFARALANNAIKGYGTKVVISLIGDVTLRRVILNCED